MTGYKYQYYGTVEKLHQALDWCRENFGDDPDRWEIFIDVFKFDDEQDYIWFLLRWS